MDLIQKCKAELLELSECSNKNKRRILIEKSKCCLIDAISEICDNFLKGNLKFDKFKIILLKKSRNFIKFLSKKKPLYKKKRIFNQHGGFLNILIPSALMLLEKILNNVKN